jgi:AmmeMemoRadiSam system protein B
MSLRRRGLPRGWYPDDPETIKNLVLSWVQASGAAEGPSIAAIAPHAGWTFSGRLAAIAAASLAPAIGAGASTLAVFGGHLPPGARPLAAGESSFDTALGPLEADLELLHRLEVSVKLGRDEESDNTVEVLLPIAAAIFPGVRILWLRAPNDASSIELGEALFAASTSIGRSVVCLGSTDLTHYGPNYGFSPKGKGRAAEAWVRDINDKRFIEAILAMDGNEAIRRGGTERSACSSGAAAAALSFAASSGASKARLLAYATSLDVRSDDSFVGYAAIAFYKELT